MGNTFSKITGATIAHPEVTEDLAMRVAASLQKKASLQGQSEAVNTIVTWLKLLSNNKQQYHCGSICFAGAFGEAQQDCLDVLGEEIFGEARVYELDMGVYNRPGCVFSLFTELKEAHGHNIILLDNITRAHPDATNFINDLIRNRVTAKYFPSVFRYLPGDKLSFQNVLFVGVHDSELFYNNFYTANGISKMTVNLLKDTPFDKIVPFVNLDIPQSNSSSAEPLRYKRTREGESSKTTKPKKKVRNSTNINTNSNNTNTNSQNPHENSHNTDSDITTTNGNENSTNSHNATKTITNSYNTTTTVPIDISNSKYRPEALQVLQPSSQPFPCREKTNVEAFVDGEAYYDRLYDVLTKAKDEVFICGWQLDPIFLKRPHQEHPQSDLFHILRSAGHRGVKVYIMLRNYARLMVPNNHKHIKKELEQTENIKISLQARRGSAFQWMVFSHHQKFVVVDRKIAFVGGLDLTFTRWDTPKHTIVDEDSAFFPGSDYYHTDMGTKTNRAIHPRTGWHDIQISVDGPIAHDLWTAFVQRWNATEKESMILDLPQLHKEEPSNATGIQCAAQVVRSISGKSIGESSKYVEQNVLKAYCELISSAESFVYIENQYFIDCDSGKHLINAIFDRIVRAHNEGLAFVIAVVLPAIPDNGGANSFVVQTVMAQQLDTIQRLERMLKGKGINPAIYIRFYSLMKYAWLHEQLVAAQVYVHSKLMVTDKRAMIGSANINNRSLNGSGDSEIAIVVDSKEFCDKLMPQLLAEHSGSPCDGEIFNFLAVDFDVLAAANAHRFNSVFGLLLAETYTEYSNALYLAKDPHKILDGVQGQVVTFPRHLLRKHTGTTWYSKFNPTRVGSG
eukprot:Phypoly_transcript_02531.p1 GENE.Phypoly_transcript_02531~~Phypoly_transcript_02531.p1  ORF type:complete len:849 (+),score=113.98 Phypoly_transcript_02531:14-2560(+)